MHCGYQRHLGLCLGYVPALAYGSCRVSDQGTTLRASDIHNARATILNPLNWGARWQPGWVFWAVLWGVSPQRLETSPTGRSGAVHVEHRNSSTALWALSWRSRFTVFWHYWWLLGELAKCRGSSSAASTAGGWKKFRCFQNWRGRLR